MRHPSTPAGNDGDTQRTRPRGAIRTHLGRKRTGPRNRAVREGPGEPSRRQQEELFDKLLNGFQATIAQAGDTTAAAFEKALDTACDALVSAGEFTADNAERMRQFLKRDLLQRDHPTMTFRTGDISTAGTFSSRCSDSRSSVLLPRSRERFCCTSTLRSEAFANRCR